MSSILVSVVNIYRLQNKQRAHRICTLVGIWAAPRMPPISGSDEHTVYGYMQYLTIYSYITYMNCNNNCT